MKKILILITIIVLAISVKAQLPNQVGQGSESTEWWQKGITGADLGIRWRLSFADTTAINNYKSGILKNIAGFTIRTVDDFWSRSNNLQKWNKINGGGSGGSGGGIVSLGNVGNYGLILVNDSTYRVDTALIATRARLMHVADSLLAIIGASSNLGNSDLTQTDDERFYNGDGKILYFSNLKSFNISTDSFPQFYFNTESGSEIARFHFDNSGNTGIGYQVFQDIKVDSAEANNANGRSALRAFIAGQGNTANGNSAMSNFLRGSNNLAGGIGSMDVLENGSRNVGLGPYIFGSINSLEFNNNTGVGYRAGFNETRSNMTYYGTIPNLPADTDPTALQDTTETPIYINGNSLEGYWNQSLNIRDSAKIGMHRISADSDSAYTKDPITGKVSYAKINSGGSGTDSSIRKGYGIIIDISGTNRTISGDSSLLATKLYVKHYADSVVAAGRVNIYNSDGTLPPAITRDVDGNNSSIDWRDFDGYNISGNTVNLSGLVQSALSSQAVVSGKSSQVLAQPGNLQLVSSGVASTGRFSQMFFDSSKIQIQPSLGELTIDSLNQSVVATNKMVVWDSVTGKIATQHMAGTYTPTLTNVANVSASTAYSCQYSRVGSVVTVSGEVDIDPTTTLTLTQLGISLPIASALTASNELAGTSADDLGTAARVAGDFTNDRAEVRMTPTDVTNRRFSFTFTYRIL